MLGHAKSPMAIFVALLRGNPTSPVKLLDLPPVIDELVRENSLAPRSVPVFGK
jgi:hypothetical protein